MLEAGHIDDRLRSANPIPPSMKVNPFLIEFFRSAIRRNANPDRGNVRSRTGTSCGTTAASPADDHRIAFLHGHKKGTPHHAECLCEEMPRNQALQYFPSTFRTVGFPWRAV